MSTDHFNQGLSDDISDSVAGTICRHTDNHRVIKRQREEGKSVTLFVLILILNLKNWTFIPCIMNLHHETYHILHYTSYSSYILHLTSYSCYKVTSYKVTYVHFTSLTSSSASSVWETVGLFMAVTLTSTADCSGAQLDEKYLCCSVTKN